MSKVQYSIIFYKGSSLFVGNSHPANGRDAETTPSAVVPLPAQGHVNPLMHFTNLLAARGYFITFITTARFTDRNFCPSKGYAEVSTAMQHPQPGLSGFRYLCIPNGLPSDHVSATNALKFIRLLRSVADEAPPITFATANSRLLLSKGYIPVNVKDAKYPEKLITCLPGNIPPLWPTDLLTSFRIQDTADASFQIALYEAEMQSKADYVLVNSFEELECPKTISGLSQGYPVLAVGPVFLPETLTGNGAAAPIVLRAWKEDSECLKWFGYAIHLDLFSIRSIVVVSNLQLQEFAFGLNANQQPFLWALRPEGLLFYLKGLLNVLLWNGLLKGRFAKEIWKIGMDFDSRSEDENVLVTRDEVEKVVSPLILQYSEIQEMMPRGGRGCGKSPPEDVPPTTSLGELEESRVVDYPCPLKEPPLCDTLANTVDRRGNGDTMGPIGRNGKFSTVDGAITRSNDFDKYGYSISHKYTAKFYNRLLRA
eukprot:Gb_30219 [translate_table: standard]